ncbi:MAG TPA: hypothetical protein VMR73_01155 [Candidatus Paceibacterota bacterium]|nr:hypothetical protein [Candidatus Paceibacterota bacterium]
MIKAGGELASAQKKLPVFIADRGILDAAAYLPGENRLEQLNEILLSLGSNIEKARARYVGVIHLVTAADGALGAYTLANNAARIETPEKARHLDKKTRDAWLGHSHLVVVGNTNESGMPISFAEKKKRVVAQVLHILGFPIPIEIEDRYKLTGFNPLTIPVEYQMISIKQHYLYSPHKEEGSERVRERSAFGGYSYFHTTKERAPRGGRIEIERHITKAEYEKLLNRSHPDCDPIFKRRYCFIWKNQYFETDVFQEKHEGLVILEREKTDLNATTELPPFVNVEQEVTDDHRYSNRALAQK